MNFDFYDTFEICICIFILLILCKIKFMEYNMPIFDENVIMI